MKDELSKVKVFQTLNYAQFKDLKGNRPPKPTHVKRLKESILEYGDLGTPTIVNEKLEMIDGQHLKRAREELKIPVLYIIKPGFGLKEIHVHNQNRKNWTMIEFMHCYADLEMKHYVRFKEFHKKYEFPLTTSLVIVWGCSPSGSEKHGGSRIGGSVDSFKRGEFIFKNPEEAEDRAERIMMLKDIYYGYKKQYFVLAMLRMFRFKDYNHSEFVLKLKQNVDKLFIEPGNVNGFLRIFEDIYNYRRHGKKIGFFQELKIRNGK